MSGGKKPFIWVENGPGKKGYLPGGKAFGGGDGDVTFRGEKRKNGVSLKGKGKNKRHKERYLYAGCPP